MEIVSFDDGQALLDWRGIMAALEAGHLLAKAEVGDTFLYRGTDTLLSRSAWIDGLGMAVKTATIFPQQTPSVNGGFCLYSDSDGSLDALVDFHLVTKWKTVGDSVLAASKLARPDAQEILIVGAGTVATSLVEAYRFLYPNAHFSIWNRSPLGAASVAKKYPFLRVSTDLEAAVKKADIISCATMTTEPIIKGAWLHAGQHLDLIGAYRGDMREADDAALLGSRVFVDNRDTVLDHIGELKTPLEEGNFGRDHVVADYYDIAKGTFKRRSDDEITLFKNGGGAHLDLMTGRYILDAWRNR